MDDRVPLRKFVENGDDAAFAELVGRHIDMVYAAALRQVYEPADAEDVTQTVFVVLAKKASTIRDAEALAGWLLVTTRFAALTTLRKERRRRHHERESASMKHDAQPAEQPAWESVRPLLDEAVARLKRDDRDAITLRYFKGQDLCEVAAALGVSEPAAQKRISRAVERLRSMLARKGVGAATTGLTSVITANVLAKAPRHLSAQVAHAALSARAVVGGLSLGITKGAGILITSNSKMAIAVVAIVVLAGIATPIAYHFKAGYSAVPVSRVGALVYRQNAPMPDDQIAAIDQKLRSSDRAIRNEAVNAIRQVMETKPDAVARALAMHWIGPLMLDRRFQEVADWAETCVCVVPITPLDMPATETLLETRVKALLALKKNDQALSAAKQFYNFVRMSEMQRGIDSVSDCLKADPKTASLVERFLAEQTESSDITPRPVSVLSGVKVDVGPFEAMEAKIANATSNVRDMRYRSLVQRGNRLLLADKPAAAQKLFIEDYKNGMPDRAPAPWLAESIARCIRAEDGRPGRATRWLEEVKEQSYPDELPRLE